MWILGGRLPGLASWVAATSSPSSAEREDRAPRPMAEAPARAKERAVARPMPLESPLMKTCFAG